MSVSPFMRQLAIVVGTLLASLSAGAGNGFPTILLHQLGKSDSEIKLDLDTSSWIGSIHGLAGLLGIVSPVVMQWKGRKFTFMSGCLLIICGWMTGYAANSIAMIFVSEILQGFGANVLITVSYDCLSEMITPTYRNVAIQIYGIVYILGIGIPGVCNTFVHWRIFCIISCIPAIFAIVISCFWLESPLWLAYKENLDRCKTNFTKLRGTDDFSIKELKEVMATHEEKTLRNKALKADPTLKRYWKQVSCRDFVIPALHIILLLNHIYWSGSSVILIYSIQLISKSTQSERVAVIGGIMISFSYIIGATISTACVRFFSNKPVLLLSTFAATLCLVGVSTVFYLQNLGILHENSLLMLYLLLGHMITSGLGQTSVVYTVTSELMPVKHRGIGGAVFVVAACSLNASSLKISPYLFIYMGLGGTFILYTVNSIICAFLIWKYVPETKGKTLAEIENFYTNGTFEIKLLSEEAELIDVQH